MYRFRLKHWVIASLASIPVPLHQRAAAHKGWLRKVRETKRWWGCRSALFSPPSACCGMGCVGPSSCCSSSRWCVQSINLRFTSCEVQCLAEARWLWDMKTSGHCEHALGNRGWFNGLRQRGSLQKYFESTGTHEKWVWGQEQHWRSG